MRSAHRLAARGESPAAFDRRCIPPGAALSVVHDGSNTPGIFPPHALRGGRLDALGATLNFHHGLLVRIVTTCLVVLAAACGGADPAAPAETPPAAAAATADTTTYRIVFQTDRTARPYCR